MSLQISSVGSTKYSEVPCTTTMTLMQAVVDQLVLSGWTISQQFAATGDVLVTGYPNPGWTITFSSPWALFPTQVWTYVATITGANQILVGANLPAVAANLAAAMTSTGLMTATVDGTNNLLIHLVSAGTGAAANSIIGIADPTASWGSPNLYIGGLGTFYTPFLAGGGFFMLSGVTAQGLQMGLFVENGGDYVRFRVASVLQDVVSFVLTNSARQAAVTNTAGIVNVLCYSNPTRVLEFVSNAHQCFLWLLADSTTGYTRMAFGIPYVRAFNAPILISAASNTSPVVLATATAHGRTTGDYVFVADTQGNIGANGYWQCVVIDPTHLSLTGSTGTGAYTSGGLLAGASTQLARAAWFTGENSPFFRLSLGTGSSASTWVVTNQLPVGGPPVSLKSSGPFSGGSSIVSAYGSIPSAMDPVICWVPEGTSGSLYEIGQLWDSFITMENVPMDRVAPNFLGFPWVQYTNSGYSMWLKRG
jgi:hypothetical protein